MASMSRREFVERAGAAAAAGFLVAGGPGLRASPMGVPIGSQVYPTRSMLKDFPAYVKMMAGIGVTRLELCSPIGYGAEFAALANGRYVRTVLADHGMAADSCHFSLKELRTVQQQSIDWAKEVGITRMVAATLADGNGGDNPTLDQVKRAAEEYNAMAAVAAKAGIEQGLHNEGFESATVDGRRVYDLLLGLLDPKLVKFQFQMSSITAGLVGAEYFEKFPGRFTSMHLQDIDMQAPLPAPPPGGRPARRPQVAVGKGTIDWVKTFRAAKSAGVRSYYVEQNWELTQQSVSYLKALTV